MTNTACSRYSILINNTYQNHKNEDNHYESAQDHIDKAQELVKDIKFAMMTTRTLEDHLHSCPMTTSETSIGAKEIWFIGDKTTETVKDIEKNAQVNLAYVSQDAKNYVSINGKAELVRRQKKNSMSCGHRYTAPFMNKVKKIRTCSLSRSCHTVPNIGSAAAQLSTCSKWQLPPWWKAKKQPTWGRKQLGDAIGLIRLTALTMLRREAA